MRRGRGQRCSVGDCVRGSGDREGLQLRDGTEGQDVATGLGGIVVDNRLRIHDRVVLLYILQRGQRGQYSGVGRQYIAG